MAFDWSEVNPDTAGESKQVKPGKAHLQCIKVEPCDGKAKVTLEIIAHEDPRQVGLVLTDFLPVEGNGLDKTFSFGRACGIYTTQILANMKSAGTNPFTLLPECTGKTVCSRLVEKEYKGRTYTNPDFIYKSPASPDVKDWPLNKGMLGQGAVATTAAAAADSEAPF